MCDFRFALAFRLSAPTIADVTINDGDQVSEILFCPLLIPFHPL
jgi:hypothetical protein